MKKTFKSTNYETNGHGKLAVDTEAVNKEQIHLHGYLSPFKIFVLPDK